MASYLANVNYLQLVCQHVNWCILNARTPQQISYTRTIALDQFWMTSVLKRNSGKDHSKSTMREQKYIKLTNYIVETAQIFS